MNISINEYNNILQIDLDKESIDRIEYIKMIEKLMHMMIYTRSNIAFALKKLTQFINDLFKRYNHKIKTLLKYLRFNFDILIIYRKRSDEVVQLIDYSNTNYAFNKNNKKSTINQVFIFENELIS